MAIKYRIPVLMLDPNEASPTSEDCSASILHWEQPCASAKPITKTKAIDKINFTFIIKSKITTFLNFSKLFNV